MSSPSPVRPKPAPRQRGSCLSMLLALSFWSGLLGGAFILLPGVFPQVLLGGGAVCLAVLGFHYIVWGKWMRKLLQESVDFEDES